MHIIIAYTLILYLHLISKEITVKGCDSKFNNFSKFDDSCDLKRQYLRKKIHIFDTILSGKKLDKIFQPAVCAYDGREDSSWYFIERTIGTFDEKSEMVTSKAVSTDGINNAEFCTDFETKALVLKKASSSTNIGSYIFKTDTFIRVYYHVDQVIPSDKIDNVIPLTVAKDAKEDLVLKDYAAVEKFALKYVEDIQIRLSKKKKIYDTLTIKKMCEYDIKVRLYCVEYHVIIFCRNYYRVKLSISNYENYLLDEEDKKIRQFTLDAFKVLTTWHSINGQTKVTAKKAAEEICTSMKFRFIEEPNYIYVPSQWTFYKAFERSKVYFNEPILKKKLSVKVNCEGYGAQQILQMTMAEELKEVIEDTPYYKHRSFMKVQKILKQGEKNVLLKCSKLHGTSEHKCSNKEDLDIKWISIRNYSVSYSIQSPISGRIYILPEDCALKIEVLKKKDEGIYNCYIKDKKSYSKYQEFPYTSYHLIVEKPFYEFPTKKELFIALISVFYISLLNVLLWMFISVWNNSKREKAYNEASERARIQNYDMIDEREDLV